VTSPGHKPQFKRRALVDLVEIWNYLAERNIGAADRIVGRLHERCDTLANNPGFGSKHPDLRPDLRLSSCEGYVIIYRIVDDMIEVTRVFHGSRDWIMLLQEDE
jgi:toxin ParE1/3/4